MKHVLRNESFSFAPSLPRGAPLIIIQCAPVRLYELEQQSKMIVDMAKMLPDRAARDEGARVSELGVGAEDDREKMARLREQLGGHLREWGQSVGRDGRNTGRGRQDGGAAEGGHGAGQETDENRSFICEPRRIGRMLGLSRNGGHCELQQREEMTAHGKQRNTEKYNESSPRREGTTGHSSVLNRAQCTSTVVQSAPAPAQRGHAPVKAFSRMNLPSLYFWLSSYALSVPRQSSRGSEYERTVLPAEERVTFGAGDIANGVESGGHRSVLWLTLEDVDDGAKEIGPPVLSVELLRERGQLWVE